MTNLNNLTDLEKWELCRTLNVQHDIEIIDGDDRDPSHKRLNFDMSELLIALIEDAVEEYEKAIQEISTYDEAIENLGAYLGDY